MKRIIKINLILLIGVLIIVSCKEEIEIATPEFEVSTKLQAYKAGEEITFDFQGNPDFISFYSGELGKDYTFKSGRVIEKGIVKLSFRTNVQYGVQANMFSVMVSSDFNGNYSDLSNVHAATWTDITNRFVLATTTTFTNSGEVDISDLVEDGKPLYIGFRYTQRDQDLFGNVRTWRVQAYNLTTETSLGNMVLGDMLISGFRIIDQDPDGPIKSRSTVTTATLTLNAATTTTENRNMDSENWIISAPVNAGSMNLGPDRPVAIKGSTSGNTTEYKYIYETPGTYKAFFTASNNNIYGAKEVVREIDLNIIPK